MDGNLAESLGGEHREIGQGADAFLPQRTRGTAPRSRGAAPAHHQASAELQEFIASGQMADGWVCERARG